MNIKKQYKKDLLSTGFFRDNKYLEEYINLIINLQTKNPEKLSGMYVHHVCPRWICKIMHVSDNWHHRNTVYVTETQHKAVHNLLVGCAIDLETANYFRGCGNIKWETMKNKFPPNHPYKIKSKTKFPKFDLKIK